MNDRSHEMMDVVQALQKGRRWIIASHQNPDGDAIGSILGLGEILRSMNHEVVLLNASGVPATYAFLPGSSSISTVAPEVLDFDGLIIMDAGHWRRIGSLSDCLDQFPTIINIDHHISNEPWGDVRWVDSEAAAVGLMIFYLALELEFDISPSVAQCLYTAIMTDTGSFRYGNTTPEALNVASKLAASGAEPQICAKNVYLTWSFNRLKLLAKTLDSIEMELDGALSIMSVGLDTLETTGTTSADLDGFTDYIRGLPGVEMAVMIRQEPKGGYKLSMRSNGRIDVAALASGLNGGGHRMAAGGFFDGSLAESRQAVVKACRSALEDLNRHG